MKGGNSMSNYLAQEHTFKECKARYFGCGFPIITSSVPTNGIVRGKYDIANMTSGQIIRALSYKDVKAPLKLKAY